MNARATEPVDVKVDGRIVRLTHLDRVLWPREGLTKGWMLEAYSRLAPSLLPHLRGRPVTIWRYPAGVNLDGWWQNECRGAPEWVNGYRYVGPDGRAHLHCVIDDLSSLMWLVNLGTVEIHPFTFTSDRPEHASWMVFDLDPGEPATLTEACGVAALLRELLEEQGLKSLPKTSGKRGMHVYVPLHAAVPFSKSKAFARSVAVALARELPDVIVDTQSREMRRAKVLIDWLQNDRSRSMVAPYSIRATEPPVVSAPLTWEEVEAVAARTARADAVTFGVREVLDRLDRMGDLFEPVLTLRQQLPDQIGTFSSRR